MAIPGIRPDMTSILGKPSPSLTIILITRFLRATQYKHPCNREIEHREQVFAEDE
jgi:hypothetical protein